MGRRRVRVEIATRYKYGYAGDGRHADHDNDGSAFPHVMTVCNASLLLAASVTRKSGEKDVKKACTSGMSVPSQK